NDLSGKGNHGELHGTLFTDGRVGSALQFDGKKDFIHLPGLRNSLVQDLQGVTVCAWIQSRKPQAFLFDVGNYGDNSVSLRVGFNGSFCMATHAGGKSLQFETPAGARWTHVAAT